MSRPTAVVTGASVGIGAAFARRLAADGSDLVLVARDTARLNALADELRAAHGTAVEVLPADLRDPAELGVVEERVASTLDPIDLLVNNAGYGTTGRFAELPVGDEVGQVELNVLAVLRLTRAVLPVYRSRGRGGVINVSSTAGFQPAPGAATYAATKSFVTSFTLALQAELAGSGVMVTALCPGFTRTEFQDRAKVEKARIPGLLWQEAPAVVDAALAGHRAGRALVVPGTVNRVLAGASRLTPLAITRRVVGRLIPAG